MREILWVAAIAVVAMLLSRGFRSESIPDPPASEMFTAEVVGPSHTVPVVVKFGAEWCGPCRAMEGELDQLESALAGKVRVVRVDVDEHRDLADHFHISGIPHTLVFHKGRGVAGDVGLLTADEMQTWLRPWLDQSK